MVLSINQLAEKARQALAPRALPQIFNGFSCHSTTMNLLLKSVLLVFGSYFIYAFILLPFTLPTYEDFSEREVKESLRRDEDIIWFIHVTDVHISKCHHPDIKEDLKEFFSTTLDIVKPSGDLTDAKDSDGVNSFQIKYE